jgi:hypothetical protein
VPTLRGPDDWRLGERLEYFDAHAG